ncbi:hypothetical protein CC78DRAFT_577328 [Lojkania enalia]|uniref:Uncharacterized protein n=1 Tax=Lojkania enalia TaxID=147567 RepID=A0A9P4N5J2_9PLEO|nr:hypothetical protein CC78DRAFT_577328 [Didymosphaeria enalia]
MARNSYIQHIYNDNDGVMIICFFQKQAEIFLSQRTFEVNMPFKRFHDQGYTEIIFAAWPERHGNVITLARVIVSQQRQRTYMLCFQRVFELLSERASKPIEWRHLHKGPNCFQAIVSDMDGKQMAGKLLIYVANLYGMGS